MPRKCNQRNIINILVACSVSCSIMLILFVPTRNEEGSMASIELQQRQDRFDLETQTRDENLLKFHTTFHLKDPLIEQHNEKDKEIKLLREELRFAKEALKELKDNPRSNGKPIQVPKCQILHVAIVCAGYKETRRVVTLIKSILFHRRNPLHFHFISDSAGRHVLQVLFETWKLQKVFISFYDADKLKTEVEWIPNRHYSGVYGLMKLTLTKALPSVLDKVIVLDTDVFFLTDIAELWSYFDKFASQQAIGLVENQSEWYTGKLWKHYKHWPALGRGFNTGVMLFDLQKLRSIVWSNLWRLTAEKQLINLLSTTLADQDVINAALKDNPSVVYQLPCEWNIQLSDNAQSQSCYEEISELKVIHWNSPKKLEVNHKHAIYFRNMYLTYLQYDGNLLRNKMFSCNSGGDIENYTDATSIPKSDQCYDFTMEQMLTRRVHLFYMDYKPVRTNLAFYKERILSRGVDVKIQVDTNDVTLMAHLSMDRLQILDALASNWEGPMSISLYVSDAEAQQFTRYAEKSSVLSKRKNIGIHIVYKDGDLYPVNYLRNVAIEQIHTDYLFLSDIDFLPMPGLYQHLKNTVGSMNMRKKFGSSPPVVPFKCGVAQESGVLSKGVDVKIQALVVPAFETFQYKMKVPQTKDHLLSLLDDGKVDTFRQSVWPQGHAPTDYEKWKTATEDYKIDWATDFEPYILIERKGLPLYDMRFVGFGWNKVSHIMELYAAGYEFSVSADGFILHMPHAPSIDISKYRSNSQYRSCLSKLKREFTEEIEQRYHIRFPER